MAVVEGMHRHSATPGTVATGCDLRERMYRTNTSGARAMAWALVVGPRVVEPLKWLRLWRESLILETGWTTFAKAGPKS